MSFLELFTAPVLARNLTHDESTAVILKSDLDRIRNNRNIFVNVNAKGLADDAEAGTEWEYG